MLTLSASPSAAAPASPIELLWQLRRRSRDRFSMSAAALPSTHALLRLANAFRDALEHGQPGVDLQSVGESGSTLSADVVAPQAAPQ